MTTRLHEVFDEAYSLAEQGEFAQITASHLLLALLRLGKSLGAQYLRIRGVSMHELAVGVDQELGLSVESRKASVPDRPWTPDGEVWLRAAPRGGNAPVAGALRDAKGRVH